MPLVGVNLEAMLKFQEGDEAIPTHMERQLIALVVPK
jgi:hypothetical protein